MLDLSEEYDEENISTCVKYFQRMSKVNLWLEMEIGITGGEEDGVDNTGVKADELYTTSEQVKWAFKIDTLGSVSILCSHMLFLAKFA